MRKRYSNLLAIAAGAILVAALGISAHAQLSSGLRTFSGTAPHGSLTTIRSEHSEVATGAREPEQENENDNAQQQAEPAEPPEAPEVDNDTNDNHNDQHDTGDDSHDSGGDNSGGDNSDD